MKIHLAKTTSGIAWVIIFIFIPIFLLAAWLMWKVMTWNPPPYDITHGNGDPETNQLGVASVIAQYGSNATIFIPEFQITLPIEALAYEWRYVVQSSSNLTDWTTLGMDWDEVLEDIQTNHALPQMFFRRVMTW